DLPVRPYISPTRMTGAVRYISSCILAQAAARSAVVSALFISSRIADFSSLVQPPAPGPTMKEYDVGSGLKLPYVQYASHAEMSPRTEVRVAHSSTWRSTLKPASARLSAATTLMR